MSLQGQGGYTLVVSLSVVTESTAPVAAETLQQVSVGKHLQDILLYRSDKTDHTKIISNLNSYYKFCHYVSIFFYDVRYFGTHEILDILCQPEYSDA